jgi:hypothetical protein
MYRQILTDDQQADGSFLTSSVPLDGGFEAGAPTYKTTFASALMLGALAGVPDPRLEPVRGRLAAFLLAQHSPEWSFGYWAKDEPEAATRPYPDDWDDTSCSVIGLTLAQPKVVTSEALGHVVRLLTLTESQEGGPYRTWIVPDSANEHWHDVDVAVNANIAYMLQLHEVELPHLEQLMDARIAEDQLSSPYYPSVYPIWYFISRWYKGQHRQRLLEHVLKQQKAGHWGTPLHTALAVSAVLNLGAKPATVRRAVERLRSPGPSGVQPEAFCIDPAINGRPYVAGSRALTAAFCLEAIAAYDLADKAARDKPPARRQNQAQDPGADRIHEQVVARVMARFEESSEVMRPAAERIRDRLLSGTAAHQITLLPYRFRQALGERGQNIGDERVVSLGMLSLYGWMAYTIYDDFLDEEGDPPLLPVANVAFRELVLAIQREALERPEFGAVAWLVLDRQEAANAWEVNHCRVRRQSQLLRLEAPDFTDLHALAERSMGHALGCVAITMELGYRPDDQAVPALQEFFSHFLIARQLCDDALDWKDDLQNGQINAVGSRLLSGLDPRPTTVHGLYEQLEQIFWKQVAADINERVIHETSQARAALAKLDFIGQPKVLEALLAPLEEAARNAQNHQKQVIKFLRAYQPPKKT